MQDYILCIETSDALIDSFCSSQESFTCRVMIEQLFIKNIARQLWLQMDSATIGVSRVSRLSGIWFEATNTIIQYCPKVNLMSYFIHRINNEMFFCIYNIVANAIENISEFRILIIQNYLCYVFNALPTCFQFPYLSFENASGHYAEWVIGMTKSTTLLCTRIVNCAMIHYWMLAFRIF